MNMLAQPNTNIKSMSTREVANMSGKKHSHVIRDASKVIDQIIDDPNLDDPCFYMDFDARGYITEIHMDRNLTLCLVSGYSVPLRMAIIKRWDELEQKSAQPQITTPQDYLSALKALVVSEEQKQLAIQERDHAIATKAEIGSRREATAMGRLSAKVKEVESLKVQLDKSLDFASIKSVEIATGRKFGWHQLKKWSKANSSEIKTIPDPNFGEVKTYHKDAWLAVYNINLSSIRGA